jgi:hypothetical protein
MPSHPSAARQVAPGDDHASKSRRGAGGPPRLQRVLISFVSTNSHDIVPVATAPVTQLEDRLDDEVGRDIFFISLTLDSNATPRRCSRTTPTLSAPATAGCS